MTRIVSIAVVGMALLAGCGPSFIILEVDALASQSPRTSFSIPDEVDSIQIVTMDAKNPDAELANQDWPLEDGQVFPLEILLEPSDGTPSELRQRVTARLNGVAKARNEVEHKWESHRTSRAQFDLFPLDP
ncbi:hypothetical protein ACFL6C_09585 [Myxococcota bacterium]